MVSIPSSSGHVHGPGGSMPRPWLPPSFNPLFIGACPRTKRPASLARWPGACFNPLFIGACPRTIQKFVEAAEAYLPFQSPLHRGMSTDSPVTLFCHCAPLAGFNPLFIGACPRTLPPGMSLPPSGRFQSPLHRGMSTDGVLPAPLRHYFYCFNPLFIGACPRTRHRLTEAQLAEIVSIPSSSGHVHGRDCRKGGWSSGATVSIPSSSGHVHGRYSPRSQRTRRHGFNPLFIGACPRTGSVPGPPTRSARFQSPLHRGMSTDPSAAGAPTWTTLPFQSPLHRGMSTDRRRRDG